MGVSNLGDLVATAQLDISPFLNNTRQLQLYMRGLDSSLKTIENSFKGQKDKLTGMKAAYTQTGHSLKGYQELLKKQTDHYNELKSKIGDVNGATSEQKGYLIGAQSAMAATAAKVSELQNKYTALAREIAVQSSAWTKWGSTLTKSGKELKTFGDNVVGVGKALTVGVTAPIVAGAGYAAKAAIQYESAFAGVKKTVDETATTSYEKLSKSIRQMSKELPASATEIANVAEVAGQLGISADNVISFSKVMVDLGESTNMSATTAAESLAKFANITKLAPENYGRLGASIVELGNNFATTEADITAMASRLAGAGAQIGLSQADIIGLSAALSSVGVEAEMGGSAFSKLMVKMQLAVTSGSNGMANLASQTGKSRRQLELLLANSPKDFKKLANSIGMTSTEMSNIVKASANLEDFARISGLSIDKFKQKFEKDAVGAIGAFINGLGTAKEKGESAIEMLTEMGFSEVRLRDSLLRAGNAQEMFSRAVDMSNKAWKENKALTNEANKRYETTESKLKMLRNEVTDIAIEFGGPLVDALRDGLEAGKPLISMLADMAKSFSSLDKGQQRQIINWGLIAAATGPGLSLYGKVNKILGSVFTGLGKTSTALGKVHGALKTGTPLLSAFSASASSATTATGGLSGAVSLLGSPLTWGVLLGGAAIAAISFFALKASEAHQRTQEWGTEVNRVQAKELQMFKEKVDETNRSMALFGETGKNEVSGVKEAFKELVNEINGLTDKKLSKDLDIAKKLGLSEETTKALKRNADESKAYVQRTSDDIIAIYQRHANDRTKLTQEEQTIVLEKQTELINKQLQLMEISGEERIAIQKAINGQINELNSVQVGKAVELTRKWLNDEKSAYEKQRDSLLEIRKSIRGDSQEDVAARAEINRRLETLESDHVATMDAYSKKYIIARRAQYEEQKRLAAGNQHVLEALTQATKAELQSMGISWEEFVKTSTSGLEKVKGDYELLGQTLQGMSEQALDANAKWKNLVWDEKNAKLKTNAQDELKKAAQSEDGWNSLQFILKNATINSNAREMIVEAMEHAGLWESLGLKEKELIVNGNQAMTEMATSRALLEQWNSLSPEQKVLLVENLTANPTLEAQAAINSVKQLTPAQIQALNQTKPEVVNAQSAIDSVVQKAAAKINAENATTPQVKAAQREIDSVMQKYIPDIKATDSASGVASNVKKAIDSIPSEKIIYIKASQAGLASAPGMYAKGTDYHPGGLAVVNDQKGPTYRELVTLPGGKAFIPKSRNVMLNLPRGSKVLPARETKRLLPHYAKGIGFEKTGLSKLAARIRNIRESSSVTDSQFVGHAASNKLEFLMSELLSWLVTNQSNTLVQQALDVAEKTAKRPQYIVMDSGALVGAIGDKMSTYQSAGTIIENMLERRPF